MLTGVVDPMHFDGVASSYSAARPRYPAALWRDVFATGLVEAGRRALELGAGSGEATGELLARGMEVVAVEPGANLADILQARLPDATVIRSRGEEVRPRPASFDIVAAATSIHWMDLEVVLPMAHDALTPDGRLLVWRNVFGDPDAEVTPFRREVRRIVERRGATRSGSPEDVDITATSIRESGLFTVERIHRYRWSVDLTSEQIRALFATFSDWSEAEVTDAATAAAALGGAVTEHYTSWLIDARPIR
jgi:SAM-dependent methyltransferase